MYMLNWWLQLVEASAIGKHRRVEIIDTLDTWIFTIPQNKSIVKNFVWDLDEALPQHMMLYGDGVPPNITEVLEAIRPMLESDEWLLFAEMVRTDMFDRAGVRYYLVTKAAVSQLTGKAVSDLIVNMVMEATV